MISELAAVAAKPSGLNEATFIGLNEAAGRALAVVGELPGHAGGHGASHRTNNNEDKQRGRARARARGHTRDQPGAQRFSLRTPLFKRLSAAKGRCQESVPGGPQRRGVVKNLSTPLRSEGASSRICPRPFAAKGRRSSGWSLVWPRARARTTRDGAGPGIPGRRSPGRAAAPAPPGPRAPGPGPRPRVLD